MEIGAIGFNMGEMTNSLKIGDRVDIIGALEINEYNGYRNIQMNLKDVMKSL